MITAVVLGGNGFIGAACIRALTDAGFETVGVGRSQSASEACGIAVRWILRDIGKTTSGDWKELLKDADVVVNAAGALQDGSRDNLEAIHVVGVKAITEALSGTPTKYIQISAAGVSATATTEFFRSKARGDAVVAASGLDWVILRPALVLGAQAYGGTALLRAAAALPLIEARVFPDSQVQSVALDDLVQAVVFAASGAVPNGTIADLAEHEVQSFPETVRQVRKWLGYPDWRISVPLPRPFLSFAGRLADGLGWLGWRSPFRTTALRTLDDGVTGDAAHWTELTGQTLGSLDETLHKMPATTQDRWFARLYLLFPLLIATLSVFWLISGAVGLAKREAATALLTERGISPLTAMLTVVGGSLIDLALGMAILWRPFARKAALAMVAVAAAYLVGGSLVAPDLWADPVGPLAKILPAIALGLVVAALLEDR